MSLFSKKKTKQKSQDDSFQEARPNNFAGPKAANQTSLDNTNSYKNELLLRGKITVGPGMAPKEPAKEPVKAETEKKSELEPETEYAQIMRINIDQKLDKATE
ncbi:MAG: hypothetical protein WCK49_06305 [Myxococcaceae bacterium]